MKHHFGYYIHTEKQGGNMSQRTGLIIAVMLTAFVLVVGGAVVGRITQQEKPPAETAVVQQLAVQQLMERESAYQDLARLANERLQQAYTKLQLQSQTQAQVTATTPAFLFSPEQAANIALQAAPGAALSSIPELVNFQGIMAYKVTLNTGIMYIDANSGQVLYNGTTPPVSVRASNQGPTKTGRNAGNGGEGERGGGERESGDGGD
jgi:uncharacterized membrane protein YkoI